MKLANKKVRLHWRSETEWSEELEIGRERPERVIIMRGVVINEL